MKHNYLLRYDPPREEFDYNNPSTWQKVFYIKSNECPEQLDFDLKIIGLKRIYHMKDEYLRIDIWDGEF